MDKIKQVESLIEDNKKDQYLYNTSTNMHPSNRLQALSALRSERILLIEQWEHMSGRKWIESTEVVESNIKFPKNRLDDGDSDKEPVPA